MGTSTGLYSTDTLKGNATVWVHQSPDGIGNTIVNMIDTRASDGLVAVATHGNGVYSANIGFTYQVTGIMPGAPAENQWQITCYPNPFTDRLNISLDLEKPGHADIDILDEAGREVSHAWSGYLTSGNHTIPIRPGGWPHGIYYCRMTMDKETVTKAVLLK